MLVTFLHFNQFSISAKFTQPKSWSLYPCATDYLVTDIQAGGRWRVIRLREGLGVEPLNVTAQSRRYRVPDAAHQSAVITLRQIGRAHV